MAAKKRSQFTWDKQARRYRGPDGRFVARAVVRRGLDVALRSIGLKVKRLANQLTAGTIDLDTWYLEMRGAVKDVQLFSTAAAKGGWDQMTKADYGRVGRIVRDQYAYLDRFVADIEDGLKFDGRFLHRATLYIESGRRTYYVVLTTDLTKDGYDEARSVLHPADHCDDCVEQAALGWQPIDEMIPIGDRQCLSACHCTAEFRNSDTGEQFA